MYMSLFFMHRVYVQHLSVYKFIYMYKTLLVSRNYIIYVNCFSILQIFQLEAMFCNHLILTNYHIYLFNSYFSTYFPINQYSMSYIFFI